MGCLLIANACRLWVVLIAMGSRICVGCLVGFLLGLFVLCCKRDELLLVWIVGGVYWLVVWGYFFGFDCRGFIVSVWVCFNSVVIAFLYDLYI